MTGIIAAFIVVIIIIITIVVVAVIFIITGMMRRSFCTATVGILLLISMTTCISFINYG